MSIKWSVVRLEEGSIFQEGYVNPTQKKPEYFDGDVKWLRAVDLNNGYVKETSRTLTQAGFESAGKSALLFEPGTLAISKSGTIGRIGILQNYMCGNRAVINIKVDEAKWNGRFIFYVLLANRPTIENLSIGSVQKNLYTSALGSLEFQLPDRQSQNTIANILSSLDEKIELNRQTNQTLEEMAQAVFKSWFVDFEPTRAKIKATQNGQDPTRAAMAALAGKTVDQLDTLSPEQIKTLTATAALFPASLVTSELGEIPEGWIVKNIGEIVSRLKPPKTYTKRQLESFGSVPVYEQGANVLLGYHSEEAGFMASPENPLFIFGDHTCVIHLSCQKFDISQNVIPLAGKGYPTAWVYYAVQGKQEFQEYRRHWSELIVKAVVAPKAELAIAYSVFVTSLYKQKEHLVRESKSLEQIRDTLLPKLLSGEIDLSEAS
ncbi:MAG: restriction endonuclease subunit S [Parvibaculaceae bacterium]|nr:restriction endonuclease subunit S [Parvibaculaceae bacterium]